MSIEARLSTLLAETFSRPSSSLQSAFPHEFIDQVLASASETGPMNLLTLPDGTVEFQGYPSAPLLQQVARVLALWQERQRFPVAYRPMQDFGTESTAAEVARCDALTPVVLRGVSQDDLEELLIALGPRGLLTCWGLRQTQGSISHLPPPKLSLLVAMFSELHTSAEERKHPKTHSILTTGARALTKHSHRSSERFWGEMSGSEARKNELAGELLQRLLAECVWINMHKLPSDTPVLELRVQRGYGARWFLQQSQGFRGFLEPQMKDGHELGWRH